MFHFLSYPKCGRTWCFAIIGKYIALKNNLSDKDIVHYAYQFNKKTGYLPMDKTHGGFAPQERPAREKIHAQIKDSRVILLKRNPYDTILSHYHDATKRTPNFKGSIDDFIEDENMGATNLKNFFKFTEELNPEYVLTYEDMHWNPVRTIAPVIKLLQNGVKVDLDILQEAVEFCKADNLREYEENFRSKSGSTRVDMRSTGGMRKVRKAKVGSYREELTEAQIKRIAEILIS